MTIRVVNTTYRSLEGSGFGSPEDGRRRETREYEEAEQKKINVSTGERAGTSSPGVEKAGGKVERTPFINSTNYSCSFHTWSSFK